MKAISLKQPWANWVAEGKKTIETRTWKTSYRGDILIVSSKQPPIEPAGQAVAVATLINCRPMTKDDEKTACCPIYPNAQAWELVNIRKIHPFAVKGSLGLYQINITNEIKIIP